MLRRKYKSRACPWFPLPPLLPLLRHAPFLPCSNLSATPGCRACGPMLWNEFCWLTACSERCCLLVKPLSPSSWSAETFLQRPFSSSQQSFYSLNGWEDGTMCWRLDQGLLIPMLSSLYSTMDRLTSSLGIPQRSRLYPSDSCHQQGDLSPLT